MRNEFLQKPKSLIDVGVMLGLGGNKIALNW
jgi:hypothetical protein